MPGTGGLCPVSTSPTRGPGAYPCSAPRKSDPDPEVPQTLDDLGGGGGAGQTAGGLCLQSRRVAVPGPGRRGLRAGPGWPQEVSAQGKVPGRPCLWASGDPRGGQQRCVASLGSWAPRRRRVPGPAEHRALAGWPEESGLAANTNVARGAGRGSAGRGVGPERGTIRPLFLRLLGAFGPRGNGGGASQRASPARRPRHQGLVDARPSPAEEPEGLAPGTGRRPPPKSWPRPFGDPRGVGGRSQQMAPEAHGHRPPRSPPSSTPTSLAQAPPGRLFGPLGRQVQGGPALVRGGPCPRPPAHSALLSPSRPQTAGGR